VARSPQEVDTHGMGMTESATLDLHRGFRFSEPMTIVGGTARTTASPKLRVTANGRECFSRISAWRTLDRAKRTFVFDFTAVVSAVDVDGECMEICVSSQDTALCTGRWAMDREMRQIVGNTRSAMAESRSWLLDVFRCPLCGTCATPATIHPQVLACTGCAAAFEQTTKALRFVDPAIASRFSHALPANVSWHEHNEGILRRIRNVTAAGGRVLDYGAGFKTRHLPNVISLDLIDYPFVDLVASGDRIPVRDDMFDLILCLSVLEHVPDPFACAREIERVLAPGGELYCIVPFLFPVHAHPHHYYNMTLQGVTNLFSERMDVRSSQYGHPIKALRQIAHLYAKGLPQEEQEQFRKLTVDELIRLPLAELQASGFATRLGDATRADLAHGTQTWFRKRK